MVEPNLGDSNSLPWKRSRMAHRSDSEASRLGLKPSSLAYCHWHRLVCYVKDMGRYAYDIICSLEFTEMCVRSESAVDFSLVRIKTKEVTPVPQAAVVLSSVTQAP